MILLIMLFRLRYLLWDKAVTDKKLLKLYPEYPRASLYGDAAKLVDSTQVVEKYKFNKGKPKQV